MRLSNLKPAPGARAVRKRVGRGTGQGTGQRRGGGHNGKQARSGGNVKVGFEGGQMPLQRRLPKRGFTSLSKSRKAEVRLHELARIEGEVADLAALKKAGVVAREVQQAKVIVSGKLSRALTLRGVGVTAGARAAIEAAGGKVEGNG